MVDTDVIVDHLRGLPAAVDYITINVGDVMLSAVTVAELYAGVRDGQERDDLDEFIRMFPVHSVTRELAAAGGLHKRDYFASHGTGLSDGIIAATAEVHGLELKTLNVRHYPMFVGLEPPYRKFGPGNED